MNPTHSLDRGTHAIETRGLTKRYGAVDALVDLDLHVPVGTVFGFLGPNGAGKTTAMKLLVGLTAPTAGGGSVLGRDIVHESTDIRGRIGFLAQEPRFYEHLTARETLRFTARFFYTGPSAAIERRVDEMLELVGLEERADRPIRGFSGGERQRLGIAQAQVNHPELLIMDEPAAALDPMGRHAVLSILERLRGRTTVLYSTHILDDVERVSDHVAILDHGRLVVQAPTRQLLTGDGGTSYQLVVRGPGAAVAAQLASLPWVERVHQEPAPEGTRLTVTVVDDEAAEAHLLRAVLEDPAVVVAEFRRRSYELEEVFLRLVRGGRPAGSTEGTS